MSACGTQYAVGARAKVCCVCGREFSVRYPSQLKDRTACSKRCGTKAVAMTKAERRLARLTRKGLHLMRPYEAYAWGYRTGYQRGKRCVQRGAA
jgi:hypothetical protein